VAELGVVTRALLSIARTLRDDHVLAERICHACVEGLEVDGAAISLMTASDLRETLYASDATVDLLEDLQFSLGEGPCMDAASSGRPVLVPDLNDPAQTRRWPIYAAAVVDQARVGAVFALPLQWGTISLGVLDLYRRAPGSLSAPQVRDAISAADAAALMLLGVRTDPDPDPDPDAEGDAVWDRSWSKRAEICQATGMVVAQLGISPTDAFARLRAHAFSQGVQLGDVAHDVVARRLQFTQDT
jgi:ANTAR domain/GAF domain